MKDIIIYSGDTVRFKHQESNSYLQSQPKHQTSKTMFPAYPDFLQHQIERLKQRQDDQPEGKKKTGEDTEEESDDNKGEIPTQIHLDLASRKQSFANSCWEV